jgi:hypothetical protein
MMPAQCNHMRCILPQVAAPEAAIQSLLTNLHALASRIEPGIGIAARTTSGHRNAHPDRGGRSREERIRVRARRADDRRYRRSRVGAW